MSSHPPLTSQQKEIFVYDRDLLAPKAGSGAAQKPNRTVPTPFVPDDPPDVLADQSSLLSWRKLFKERRAWAMRLSQASESMIQEINTCASEIDVIGKATTVAAENAKQHIESLNQKYEETLSWAEEILQDQEKLQAESDELLKKYRTISIHESLKEVFLGAKGELNRGNDSSETSQLDSLIDSGEIKEAKARSSNAVQALNDRLRELQLSYEDVVQDGNDLSNQVQSRFLPASDKVSGKVGDLADELEATVRQISSDYESTLTAPNDARTIASISKTALLHTRKFLPSLSEVAIDIGDLLRRTVERRNSTEEHAIGFMQRIAAVESTLASVQTLMRNVDLDPEDGAAMESLGRVAQIPFVYASLLVEIVRRQEWNEKMTTDSATLAEELATYREDEEKRRRKWLKTVGEFLDQDALSSKTRSIEINVQGQDRSWPNVTREDIAQFTHELDISGGFEELLGEMAEWIKALDAPSKQQAKRSNAFRKGALSESGFGRNSLLLRGEDDLVNSLQTEKLKLEDRLKGSESRIRKLEDLLHRSSQMNQPHPRAAPPPSVQVNQPSAVVERKGSSATLNYATSPKTNDLVSRRSSVASHRLSLNQGADDENLVQKIIQLETELANERKKSTQVEESAQRHMSAQDDLRIQVKEAAAMKQDLMDNFEAQQHEFDAERRLLEDEIQKWKVRVEEMEEDYDRVLGSHDNARDVFNERTRDHEEELKKVRSDALKEMQRAEDRIGNLQAINENQRDRLDMLEEEILRNSSAIKGLQGEMQQRDNAQSDHFKVLKLVQSRLGAEDRTPDTFEELVYSLDLLSQRTEDQNRELRVAMNTIKDENTGLETRVKGHEEEVLTLHRQLSEAQHEATTTQQDISSKIAETKEVQEALENERKAIDALRAQVPGSETLKEQLAEAERKAESLGLQFAAIKASNLESENELSKRIKAIEALQVTNDSSKIRLHDRARRAAEVSLQLFLQTDRLTRLLEHIGFIVSREDAMVVQRMPRATSTNHATGEQSQIMTRSVSGLVPSVSNNVPPEYLHWASVEDPAQEHRFFEAFINESKAFNLDAFSEAVVKRVKDTEHIARKWQREARTYRDRFRGAQFEAQHKIAFRSFKEGDLALFLPTRSQAPQRSWAAFNVGAPHYFLKEQDHHRLTSRDWLLARILKVEERVVDLSKGIESRLAPDISEDGASIDEENPFGLSDGLRWYYLDAEEERLGAPISPGPAKTTVASAQIDAEGSIQRKKNQDQGAAARVLTSLESRRSSANSKKSTAGAIGSPALASGAFEGMNPTADNGAEDSHTRLLPRPHIIPEEVRKDQLLDP